MIESHDALVINGYLNGAEANLTAAREALGAGDTDTLQDRLDALVHDARQAQARTEQSVMLTEEREGS